MGRWSLNAVIEWLKRDPFADPWKVHYYEHLANSLSRDLTGTSSVIDLGCGEGLFSTCVRRALPPASLFVGMDIAEEAAWRREGEAVNYLVGDASRPPFKSNSVKVVIAKDLLHHMDDPRVGVEWLLRMATDKVVIVEANADNPVMSFYTRHNGDRHMTREELSHLLSRADPGAKWEISGLNAYPFYLPPVRTIAALWVWPLTGVMLLLFKLLRWRRGARLMARLVDQLPFAPSFNVAVCLRGIETAT